MLPRKVFQEQEAASKNKIDLNTSLFLLNALINDIIIIQALVDNGYLCPGIFDAELSMKLKLPRMPV